jgi:hypothetical protein
MVKMTQFHINNLQIKAYYHNTKEKRVTTFTITTRKVISALPKAINLQCPFCISTTLVDAHGVKV